MTTPQAFKTIDVLRLEVERDALAGEYKNLIPNPGGALGGWGWITPVSGSVLRAEVNSFTISGVPTDRLGLTYITGTTIAPASNYFYSERFTVTAGQYLRTSYKTGAAPYGAHRTRYYFYSGTGAFISESIDLTPASVGEHTGFSVQVPVGATLAAYSFEVANTGNTYPYTGGGAKFTVTDIRTVQAATSDLTGTALLSAPADNLWTNVLGPTHEIRVAREDLNLGTLNATILDSTIDPATAQLLRTGRDVRLLALSPAGWSPLFTGEVLTANVTYDLPRRRVTDPKHARIALVAVDPVSNLASAPRPEGVAAIADLPFVLEGARTPWNVNGSGNQVSTAPVASRNEAATAVDQISLTRDTARGYAWVSRHGVLNAWTSLPDPTIELMGNGGFDADTTGWSKWDVSGSSTLTRTTTSFKTAPGAAQVAVSTAGTTQVRIARPGDREPVTSGTPYRFSAWSQAATTPRKIPLYVDWYDAAGAYLSTSGDDFNVATSTNTTSWAQYVKDVVAPPRAAWAEPTLCVGIATASTAMAAGEIHRWDDISFRATSPIKEVSETTYADISLSYDPNACINSIDYKWHVLNTYTGATDTYDLKGYRDDASIATYGVHHKTFTIHGASANAAAHAADVFARNATPAIRPTSVTLVALRTAADVTAHAFVDLYDLHHVTNAAKGIDRNARVTSISHEITGDRWKITLGYSVPNAVASPQVLPPVQDGTVTGPPYMEAVYSTPAAAVGAAWVTLGGWTVVDSSQVTVDGAGAFTIQRPGRYRIRAFLVYDATGAAGAARAGRLAIGALPGTPLPYAAASGMGGAAFCTVETEATKRLAAGAVVSVQAFAGAAVNLLGGTAGYGNTRIEIQHLGD